MTRPSISEQLTDQFYRWELRGRGWTYKPELPVELEPPFVPFYRYLPKQEPYVDDGRYPSLLGRIARNIYQGIFPPKEEPQEEEELVEPEIFHCTEGITVLHISVPRGIKIGIAETEQLLLMLSYCRYPLSFELLASRRDISIQLVSRTPDAIHVKSQVQAFFPGCIITETADILENILTKEACFASVIHYGLAEEFMRPLHMPTSFNPDPLTGICGALEGLADGTYACIQVLFTGTTKPWTESIVRSVTASDGKSFFSDAPEMLSLTHTKLSSPLFAVSMRVVGVGKSVEQARNISRTVGAAFGRIYFSPSNSLIPLKVDIHFQENIDSLILRHSHLTGMFLNSRELMTLVHLPGDTVHAPKLKRSIRRTKEAPDIATGHPLVLGVNEHMGKDVQVSVSAVQRLKHMHIIGATGTGKSTLLQSLITQDIQQGNGIAVLDPHGDLIDSILAQIPKERLTDVVLIDPADTEYSVGFNILSAHSDVEKEILASDLVASFRRLSSSWGDQMNSVLANAILAYLESPNGGTLADLRRFLIEKPYRDSYLKTVTDPNIVYYWQKEYPLLKSNSIGSILTRLDTFLRPKPIRYMVAQKSTLDFEQILDTKKILLIKLSQGLIGNENSYLLGTFFVTKLYQAAMARQAKEHAARTEFFVYIDEFQNFITPSMSLILSGARKYHMGLILAHQDMQQVSKHDSELASAVVSNAGTRICFRLGDTDAKRFASGFSFFEAQDLENLHTGEAIARIERPDYDFSLRTIPSPPDIPHVAARQEVIDYCRGRYATKRVDIEQQLQEETTITEVQSIPKTPPLKVQPLQAATLILTEESIAETKQKLVAQKEETEHRYLQNLIKKMAESRGYKAIIEASVPDGTGRVDVLLERSGKQIACEVSVTTDVAWEMHNIQKCLDAGYVQVVECSTDTKTLEQIRAKVVETFSKDVQEKILVGTPEELFAWLDEQVVKEASTEKRMRGYRVKVEYSAVSASELKHKQAAVSKAVLGAMAKHSGKKEN